MNKFSWIEDSSIYALKQVEVGFHICPRRMALKPPIDECMRLLRLGFAAAMRACW